MRVDPKWKWTRYALICVGLVAATAAVLLVMGRTMWGAASGPGLWSGDIHSKLNSQLLADPYVFTHVSHGLVFFLILWAVARQQLAVGVRFLVAVFLEGLWEILENTPFVIERFRETTMAQGYYGDSVLNSIGDMGAMIVGYLVAARLSNRWAVLGVFLALEGLLALWIRDNMLLNILMLVYPVPGVRQWQAGG